MNYPHVMRKTLFACAASLLFAPSLPSHAAELQARAVLPAVSFAKGPDSGQYIGSGSINGIPVPFDDQPVQGFSAIARNGDGSFLAMSDNGYGSLQNSADYHLRVYTIRPRFETAQRGVGTVAVTGFFELHDPDGHVPFAIVNDFSPRRVLTGADFDIESMQRAADGSLWFGDEFGPFLLHTDASGRLLEAPIALPDFDHPGQELRSPSNPFNEETAALRILNAARAHAERFGNFATPVFSPYHVELKYPGSDPDLHYARGVNSPADLAVAASDIHDIAQIRAAGFPVVPYTINDKARMLELMAQRVDGIISDRPDILLQAIREFDANGDGTPGDYLDAEGLPDGEKFDAQGHRGARDLRPENTLPAMEAALDNLVTTLETDTGTTSDRVPILSHDPYVQADKCRRADGAAYGTSDQVLIKDFTAAELQATYICDKLFRGESQINDPDASPVAVAFASQAALINLYQMPTLAQLYAFVDFYADYYTNGAGAKNPEAAQRAASARKVRFNVETKINPRADSADSLGNVYRDRTVDAATMTDALLDVIVAQQAQARTDVQSFDFRTLLITQQQQPDVRTVYLFGDFPIITDPARLADSDDGTNLQPDDSGNTPWMAGLYWPYRSTVLSNPFRVPSSGGFEGMALSADGSALLPMLERPLDNVGSHLPVYRFDLASGAYTGLQALFPLDVRGTNIGDFILFNENQGLVIERDGSQGSLSGYKTIQKVTLNGVGEPMSKALVVDLLNIADPAGISLPGESGDVGLGDPFAFPFVTIEDVVVLDEQRIGVLNDNNFPFSVGRHTGTGAPDDNEFIVIQLDEPLALEGQESNR